MARPKGNSRNITLFLPVELLDRVDREVKRIQKTDPLVGMGRSRWIALAIDAALRKGLE